MDIFEAINTRRSVRRYSDKPVSDELLNEVFESVRQSPSWANMQCWRFVAVRNTEVKEKLATTLHKGEYLIEHPGGGGGFGDPYERDPQKVLDDVIDEYVSIEKAEKDYGVVIKEKEDEYK